MHKFNRNGNTLWTKIYSNGTNNLFNAGYQDGYYVPGTDQIYWKKVEITLPTGYRAPSVRFRVQVFSSHYANNFYLDDWNVGLSPTGIEEGEVFGNINVMPNPFASKVPYGGAGNIFSRL